MSSSPIKLIDRHRLDSFLKRRQKSGRGIDPRSMTPQLRIAYVLREIGRMTSPGQIASQVGFTVSAQHQLIDLYRSTGLEGVITALRPGGRRAAGSKHQAIVRSAGICGGSARIAGTRIPVWTLVEARMLGASDADLLRDFPSLRRLDLAHAWTYAVRHRTEISQEIAQNAVA